MSVSVLMTCFNEGAYITDAVINGEKHASEGFGGPGSTGVSRR